MTDFLEKNLAVIRETRPFLHQMLAPYLEDTSVVLTAEAGGWQNLTLTEPDGKTWRLYSGTPDQEYQRSAEISQNKQAKVLVFDGVGLGYHLFEYFRKNPKGVQEILILEKDPRVFLAALRLHDFSNFFNLGNFEVFVGLPVRLMFSAAMEYFRIRYRLIYANSIVHFFFEPALKRDGEYYLEFSRQSQKAIEHLLVVSNASSEDNYWGLANLLRNLPRFEGIPHVDIFKKAFQGAVGIVVAAGPSLDLHLDRLEEYAGKALVIATDGSLRALRRRNIKPHLLVTIERNWDIKLISDQIPADFGVPAIFLPSMHPGAFRNYPQMVVMTRNATFGKWFWPGKSQLFVGTHVGSMALSLLMHMGCEKAILLGQDLAYDPVTKQSHFQGQLEETVAVEMSRIGGDVSCSVIGNNGEKLASNIYWDLFRKDIEYIVDVTAVDVFNAIPIDRGAKIRNTLRIDPSDVPKILENYPVRDFPAEIAQILAARTGSVGLDPRLERVSAALNTIEARCIDLQRRVSIFFSDHQPVHFNVDEARVFANFVGECRLEMAAILNIDTQVYSGLLNEFLMGYHVKILTTLENLDPENFPDEYMNVSISSLHLWLSEVMYWSRRMRYLVDSILRGELAV